MSVKTARRIRRQIIRNLSNRLTTLLTALIESELKSALQPSESKDRCASDCSRWVLPSLSMLDTTKRLLGTAIGAGLSGRYRGYCSHRSRVTIPALRS